MDALLGLQKLSVVSRVCTELKNHIGVDDKTLAEFIIDLVRAKMPRSCRRGTGSFQRRDFQPLGAAAAVQDLA